jgi:nucleotide-binding universal stress UspA family protein
MSSSPTDTQPDHSSSAEVRGRRRRLVTVVGYDGSDNGRNVVAGAARRVGPGDRLIIVHALEPGSEGADPASRYDQICQQMISDLDAAVLDGIDHELRVVRGSPAQVLIDVALHTNATGIIVGTRRARAGLSENSRFRLTSALRQCLGAAVRWRYITRNPAMEAGRNPEPTRDWYPALEAARIKKRAPYQLRHTFATEALAAGISIFELARVMGTSVAMIDRTYGHLARDSEQAIRARLDARAGRTGVVVASDPD